ncbi:MAG TPA: lysylphosphatidylglycerol synthase transmembrane domain-containing protein [Anaerolineaceae bacterium]|nr:lysylphosphatidylglycerol synthase transmembrane domain-containing protein [Anaerolineaceae bacterium]
MTTSDTEMAPRPQRKISILRLLGTVLSIGLLIWLIEREGWSAIKSALTEISWWNLVLVLLLTFVSRFAVTGRWHVLLRSGGVPIRLRESIRLVFAGLFASNFLPTTVGGDLIRFAGAVRLHYDAAICAASLVMDRLVGMVGMLTVFPVGLLRLLSLPLPPLPGAGTSAGMLVTISLGSAWQWIRDNVHKLFQSTLHALRLWATHPRDLGVAYLFTLGHMAALFATVWLILHDLGQPISFWLVAGLWSISYLVTLLPISINGLGVQELSLTFLFTNYGGLSVESVAVMAVLIRLLQMVASLPGAVFVPALIQPDKAPTFPEKLT